MLVFTIADCGNFNNGYTLHRDIRQNYFRKWDFQIIKQQYYAEGNKFHNMRISNN